MMNNVNADLASERAVLAGIFKHGSDVYIDVSDLTTMNTYTNDVNQALYKCFQFLFDEKKQQTVDLASIFSAASTLGLNKLFEKEEDRKLIRAISNYPINKENVRSIAAKIRKLEITRQLRDEIKNADRNLGLVTGEESVDHILGIAENSILDFTSSLSDTKSNGPEKIGDGIKEYINYLANNPKQIIGISSGNAIYDAAIGGGFRKRTVNVIGARPKVGKTTLADNICLHVAGKLSVPVLNLDTEMSKEDHWNRMVACLSGVKIRDIETGLFSKNEASKHKVIEAVKILEKIPYDYISIAGQPFEETVSMMRRWIVKNVGFEPSGEAKPCLIIYDYLKLMSSEGLSKNLQEYQMLGFQMTALHNFMVRYGVACLAFMQLNRDGITKEDTDVASGSDRIIWLCSNFSIFKPKTVEEKAEELNLHNENYNRKLIPIVCRHGPALDDGDYINMKLIGDVAKITEGRTRNDVYKDAPPPTKDNKKKHKKDDDNDVQF